MSAVLRVVGVTTDRRTKRELAAAAHLEQERVDAALESLWRERVRENELRRYVAKNGGTPRST